MFSAFKHQKCPKVEYFVLRKFDGCSQMAFKIFENCAKAFHKIDSFSKYMLKINFDYSYYCIGELETIV